MRQGVPFTFQDLATRGSTIATAPFERERFDPIIREINDRFGLSLEPREEVYALLADRLRLVAGRYWQETQAIDRKSVLDQLEKLTKSVKSVADQLRPMRGGLHEGTEVVSFLVQTIDFAHRGGLDKPAKQLETILTVVESLEAYCERGLAVLSHVPGKKGQRGLAWYVPFVELMTEAAGQLGIKVTTAGDRRADDPYATPFTVFVYHVEDALPEKARSNLLSTCAKRIEDSRKRKPARGNASKM